MKDFFRETIQTIISSIILTAFIYFFIATPNEIKGPSMLPNVQNGDLILTNRVKHLSSVIGLGKKIGWDYQRGEIIIFKLPGREAYIKRIVGIPGDKVQILGNHLVVNGNVVFENYLASDVKTKPEDFINENPVIVPENSYLAFGDNRSLSLDSRYSDVGFIEKRYIIGPAALRLFPLKSFGFIKIGTFYEKPVNEVRIDNNGNIKVDLT